MEYDSGHLGYPMYGGSYESDTLSRKLEGGSKWVEFDKSPDTEKTLLSKPCGNVEATRDGEESVSNRSDERRGGKKGAKILPS